MLCGSTGPTRRRAQRRALRRALRAAWCPERARRVRRRTAPPLSAGARRTPVGNVRKTPWISPGSYDRRKRSEMPNLDRPGFYDRRKIQADPRAFFGRLRRAYDRLLSDSVSDNGSIYEVNRVVFDNRNRDLELRDRVREVEHMMQTIEASNEPSVLESATFAQLEQIAQNRIRLESGKEVPFLKQNELVSLQVRRGTLDQTERLEIESHVTHTYRFLIQIPWTSDLRNVPDIAHGHHEKIDGSGYPLRLRGEEILPQSKMMTIADIFDALTAPDRPYKRSLSAEQALDILKIEA